MNPQDDPSDQPFLIAPRVRHPLVALDDPLLAEGSLLTIPSTARLRPTLQKLAQAADPNIRFSGWAAHDCGKKTRSKKIPSDPAPFQREAGPFEKNKGTSKLCLSRHAMPLARATRQVWSRETNL
jgi:hypothetical protein